MTKAKWVKHDDLWMRKQYQVAPDRWLLLFYEISVPEDFPAGWVSVLKKEWTPQDKYDHEGCLRETSLAKPASILEVECVAMEWEKEILDGSL